LDELGDVRDGAGVGAGTRIGGAGAGVDCAAELGVAPWAFVSEGAAAGNPDPGGIGGTTGCFWPGSSVMCPLFRVF
jgi:hypothetical protein